MDHLEDVHAELATGPVPSARAYGLGHVSEPYPPGVPRVSVGQGNILPGGCVRAPEAYWTVGEVGVGEAQGTFCTVEVDPGLILRPNVEGGDKGSNSAALEVHHAGDVGRSVHRDGDPREGFAGDRTLWERDARRPGDPPHGPHQGRERGEVVGSHVEHRASAGLEVEVRVRMPVLGAVAEHERRYGDGLSYDPLVHDLAAGLEAATQEGVRGTADPEVSLGRHFQHPTPVLQAHCERLLGVYVLASLQSRQRDLGVDHRDCQVEDDLDLFIGQQLLRAASLGHAVRLSLGFGALEHEVRTGDDLHVVERGPVLQIDAADLAAPDYSDLDRRVFADGRSFQLLSMSARSALRASLVSTSPVPDDLYYVALDPGYVLSGERGGREDIVARVDVHVVLLGVHAEVFEA